MGKRKYETYSNETNYTVKEILLFIDNISGKQLIKIQKIFNSNNINKIVKNLTTKTNINIEKDDNISISTTIINLVKFQIINESDNNVTKLIINKYIKPILDNEQKINSIKKDDIYNKLEKSNNILLLFFCYIKDIILKKNNLQVFCKTFAKTKKQNTVIELFNLIKKENKMINYINYIYSFINKWNKEFNPFYYCTITEISKKLDRKIKHENLLITVSKIIPDKYFKLQLKSYNNNIFELENSLKNLMIKNETSSNNLKQKFEYNIKSEDNVKSESESDSDSDSNFESSYDFD